MVVIVVVAHGTAITTATAALNKLMHFNYHLLRQHRRGPNIVM